MSYNLLSETFPISRKPHRCIWCGESIPIGEKYRREKSVYDGGMQNHPWHIECNLAAQDIWRGNGDTDFMAFDNERPERLESKKENK